MIRGTILVKGKIKGTNEKSWLTLKLTLLSLYKLNSNVICLKDPEVSTSGCWDIKLFGESAPRSRYNNREELSASIIIACSRGNLVSDFVLLTPEDIWFWFRSMSLEHNYKYNKHLQFNFHATTNFDSILYIFVWEMQYIWNILF